MYMYCFYYFQKYQRSVSLMSVCVYHLTLHLYDTNSLRRAGIQCQALGWLDTYPPLSFPLSLFMVSCLTPSSLTSLQLQDENPNVPERLWCCASFRNHKQNEFMNQLHRNVIHE